MKRTDPDSFIKIVGYGSCAYEDLNQPKPTYRGEKVKVISVEELAVDEDDVPVFCYELVFCKEEK